MSYEDIETEEAVLKEKRNKKIKEKISNNNKTGNPNTTIENEETVNVIELWKNPNKRDSILLGLKIPVMDYNDNLCKIVAKEFLPRIFASKNSKRTRKKNPEILEKLEHFKHKEIFSLFSASIILEDLPSSFVSAIDKAMDYVISFFPEKLSGEANKDPLRAYQLTKNGIPVCKMTLSQKTCVVLEKKRLAIEQGLNPANIAIYGMSIENIQRIGKDKIKKERIKSKKKAVKEKGNNAKSITYELLMEIIELNENVKTLTENMENNCKKMDDFIESVKNFSEKF